MHEDRTIGNPASVEQVIPLHAEQIEVSRLTRETGKVKVSTTTKLREQLVDELLAEDRAEVKQVAVGRIVEAMPEVRQEGDTVIVPVVEEVLVVEKRLFLKEEIHITRVRTTSSHQETVTLRFQEAVVTRLGVSDHQQVESHNLSMKDHTDGQ